ncbi:hypothetical protein FQN54_006298 [Arachnomyces sp. PD_36]|nr:hypothetical protein FQN54_006298 [Arachnomyces sp. PD_36]
MGSRKRVKPNELQGDSRSALNREQATEGSAANAESQEQGRERATVSRYSVAVASCTDIILIQILSMQSWYLKSWPRGQKAAAVTEVARESISAPGNGAAEPTGPPTNKSAPQKHLSPPSFRLTQKEGASTRSLPADAATTPINVASKISASTTDIPNSLAAASDAGSKKESNDTAGDLPGEANDSKGSSENISGESEQGRDAPNEEPDQPSSWLGWLSRAPTTSKPTVKSEDLEKPAADTSTEGKEQLEEPPPEPTENEPPTTEPPENETSRGSGAQKRTWMQMWGGTSTTRRLNDERRKETNEETESTSAATEETTTEAATGQPDSNSADPNSSTEQNTDANRSSIWGFWYRDKPGEPVDQGLKEIKGNPKASASGESSMNDDSKESKSQSKTIKDGNRTVASGSELDAPAGTNGSSTPPTPKTKKTPEATASKHLQRSLPNQLLPSFKDTFPPQQRPSLLQQLGRLIHYSKEPDNSHVYQTPNPPHIKKAVAIGIHGYFPAPFIRSVIGQPTGTSVKFSDLAAKAIHKWTEDHGYSCEVEKIALEGEGRIAERGELLWKLLLNWIEDLRKADFILISCHSQGVPVAVMLVAKLIAFGCVNAARIGICAMAGVNMGPFVDYRSRWISGSAGELFDFSNPNSQVSQDYSAALETALNFGVRIAYIGSIDDQLVSLESSTFASVSHPYIYRAVFVDGRAHAPSFLSHLVGFALKLRNLGISDHGMIRELSSPLAGSLYSGEGHSRLYDDESVY